LYPNAGCGSGSITIAFDENEREQEEEERRTNDGKDPKIREPIAENETKDFT